jgi:hypothetical protein
MFLEVIKLVRHMRKEAIVILVVLLAVIPFAQAGLLDFLAGLFDFESNLVGRAYQGFLKCREMELKADEARKAMADTCKYPGYRMQYYCSQNQELLSHYQGYLDTYCTPDTCLEGATRCMTSISGETAWLEVCIGGTWRNSEYCHEGCGEDECNPEIIDFKLTAHPSMIIPGQSSIILVDVHRRNNEPVVGALVKVGVSQGVLFAEEAYTDQYGQAMIPWVAGTRGYARVSALSEIGDLTLTDSIYVHVT